MIRLIILVAAFLMMFSEGIQAQEISYGFRVGLNSSTFLADEEELNGESLESFSYNTGFHVGGGIRVAFSDLWGLRSEIVFTQKGTKRTFEGPSFFVFQDPAGEIVSMGQKTISLNISNAYLEIPVMVYGKLGRKIEVFGGVYGGFLVGSTATGELIYENGTIPNNNNLIQTLQLALDYNYNRDEAGELIDAADDIEVQVGNANEFVTVPNTLTAYYDLEEDEKDGKPFKVFDAGLSAGAAYFLNGGLYFSAIAQYGLIDVSNTELDFSNTIMNTTRDDQDTNLSFQFSVGFSF